MKARWGVWLLACAVLGAVSFPSADAHAQCFTICQLFLRPGCTVVDCSSQPPGLCVGFDDPVVPDCILGTADSETILGQGGDDCICGGAGNDDIQGGDGADVLIGEDDIDTLLGGPGDDLLFGLDGADTINGGPGNDFMVTLGDWNTTSGEASRNS